MASDALQTLARVGLKKIDIAVYTTCLGAPAGVYVHEIVKKTAFNRSSIDLSVTRLIGMGYISKRKQDKRWVFIATKPEDVLARQEMLLEDMRAAVPMLSRLTDHEGVIDSQFYHGYDGLQKAYDQMLLTLRVTPIDTDAGHVLAIGNGAKIKMVYADWQRGYIERRKRLKRWFKAVAPESSRKVKHWDHSPENLRDVRFIATKDFDFNAEIEIFGDSVLIYTATEPVGGIIIRNPIIADSFRAMHGILWNVAKP